MAAVGALCARWKPSRCPCGCREEINRRSDDFWGQNNEQYRHNGNDKLLLCFFGVALAGTIIVSKENRPHEAEATGSEGENCQRDADGAHGFVYLPCVILQIIFQRSGASAVTASVTGLRLLGFIDGKFVFFHRVVAAAGAFAGMLLGRELFVFHKAGAAFGRVAPVWGFLCVLAVVTGLDCFCGLVACGSHELFWGPRMARCAAGSAPAANTHTGSIVYIDVAVNVVVCASAACGSGCAYPETSRKKHKAEESCKQTG